MSGMTSSQKPPLLASPRTLPAVVSPATLLAANSYVTATLSGAMTAATYKEVVAVSGAGVLNLAWTHTVDTTSRDIAMKIVIDGTQVIEQTASGVTTAGDGLITAGYMYVATDVNVTFDQIPFSSSLSISIKSSLSETDKMRYCAMYRTV